MTVLRSERAAVQNPFARYALDAGWTYLPCDEALRLRHGDTGLLLDEVLIHKLQRLNPGVMHDARADVIVGATPDENGRSALPAGASTNRLRPNGIATGSVNNSLELVLHFSVVSQFGGSGFYDKYAWCVLALECLPA